MSTARSSRLVLVTKVDTLVSSLKQKKKIAKSIHSREWGDTRGIRKDVKKSRKSWKQILVEHWTSHYFSLWLKNAATATTCITVCLPQKGRTKEGVIARNFKPLRMSAPSFFSVLGCLVHSLSWHLYIFGHRDFSFLSSCHVMEWSVGKPEMFFWLIKLTESADGSVEMIEDVFFFYLAVWWRYYDIWNWAMFDIILWQRDKTMNLIPRSAGC